MQTNSANGHHQHKGSVKILMPGTFPCRLDMEICACGATRWVDQNRTPATPWQFINRRTSPIRKEDARVAPRTSPQSALEGLITCGSCGKTDGPRRHTRQTGSQLRLPAGTQKPLGPVSHAAAARPQSGNPAGPHGAADSPDRREHLQGTAPAKRPPSGTTQHLNTA